MAASSCPARPAAAAVIVAGTQPVEACQRETVTEDA